MQIYREETHDLVSDVPSRSERIISAKLCSDVPKTMKEGTCVLILYLVSETCWISGILQ